MKNIQINHAQKGFTLIELMIVVAIIGILAAIAIPQYQDYIARSQTTRVLGEISAAKTATEESLSRGVFPADAAALGMTSSNLMNGDVPNVAFASGAQGLGTITAQFGADASAILNGEQIRLSRDTNGNWSCTTTLTEASGYVPSSCTGGGL
ncbi:MAG: pilin [Marinobacter sp.]|nr:pilin [Marinobacter sp.]|tara:strand:- start:1035 stop:1490 length:456 start_codon:yes stop_codon:yes gene_type:complete